MPELKVLLTMLPPVDVRLTSPPLMTPDVLVMSPVDVTTSDLPPTMVPPVLVSDVRFRVASCAEITAPLPMAALVLCDRYTTGASTVLPSTTVCTIHTMSCFSPACCSGVSALPNSSPRPLVCADALSNSPCICASAFW